MRKIIVGAVLVLILGVAATPAQAKVIYCGGSPGIVTVCNGTSAEDTMYGNGYQQQLWGQGDGDVLYGYGGNDDLHGNGGSDTLIGGAGYDICRGGDGLDGFAASCEVVHP